MDNRKRSRDAVIEVIRAVSISYIVGMWHLLDYTIFAPLHHNFLFSRLTLIALGMFVLISGFLIGVQGCSLNGRDVFSFYKRRILRIYPPYFVAIVLFFVLRINDGTTLSRSVTPLSIFFTPMPITLWFVSMILFFYLISPVLIFVSRSFCKYIIVCTVGWFAMVAYSELFPAADIRAAIYFPAFAAGIYIGKQNIYEVHRYSNRNTIILLVISIFLTLSFDGDRASDILGKARASPLALFGPLLFLSVLRRIEISSNGVIRHLDYASFFMYLLHRPIYQLLSYFYLPANGTTQVLYLLSIGFSSVVAVSWLGQKSYDILLNVFDKLWDRKVLRDRFVN